MGILICNQIFKGEKCGDPKKRRLIDSILRDWHVPPIHVVEVRKTAQQEVLDGQQRLVAIRDFVRGNIRVDGNTQPEDEEIKQLDGLSYEELPLFGEEDSINLQLGFSGLLIIIQRNQVNYFIDLINQLT